jgi:SAM-dependent methyltransferase
MALRMARASAALDVDTGGGEVLASVPRRPPLLVATESWLPNIARAQENLTALGVSVVATAHTVDLPFGPSVFDLVVSRHPVVVHWPEIARLLRPGGTYLSQQVGPGSVSELTDFLMGPQPVNDHRSPDRALTEATTAGLDVVDLRRAALRIEFHDVAAVIVFLRKVIWIVPGFTVDLYRHRLATLHDQIRTQGPFVAHSTRFLIEARMPG